jgi:hypothetical protein
MRHIQTHSPQMVKAIKEHGLGRPNDASKRTKVDLHIEFLDSALRKTRKLGARCIQNELLRKRGCLYLWQQFIKFAPSIK